MTKRLLIVTVAIYVLQVGITHRPSLQWVLDRTGDDEQQAVSNVVEAERLRREIALHQPDAQTDQINRISLEEYEAEARRRYRQRLMRPIEGIRLSTVQEAMQLSLPEVWSGQVWRLVTYAFCHSRGDIGHLAFNMIGLYMFGRGIELRYGGREFFLFYLVAAIASAVAYLALDLWLDRRVPSIGASGAVMGILMLYTLLHPDAEVLLFFFLPVPIRWLCAGIILYDLYPVVLELTGRPDDSGVAHAAHLGGLAFGYLYYRYDLNLRRGYDRYVENGLARWFLPQAKISS